MELLKECNNERVYALNGGWIITGIVKQKCKKKEGSVDKDWNCKNKRADALRGRVDNEWNC